MEASEEVSSSGSSSYEVVGVLTRYRDRASREAPIEARIRPRTCRVRPRKSKLSVEVVDQTSVTICKDLDRVDSQKAGGNGQGDQGVWSQRVHCEAEFQVFLPYRCRKCCSRSEGPGAYMMRGSICNIKLRDTGPALRWAMSTCLGYYCVECNGHFVVASGKRTEDAGMRHSRAKSGAGRSLNPRLF
jgi:hypothetical protein